MSDTALSTCHLLRAPASEGGRLLRGDASGERHLLFGCTVGLVNEEFTYEFVGFPTPNVVNEEFTYEFVGFPTPNVVNEEFTYEFVGVTVSDP